MAERPSYGMMGANNNPPVLNVLSVSPWKRHCSLEMKNLFFSYILCICFRPQEPWTVAVGIFNSNLDLIFTSRRSRQGFQREKMMQLLLPSCSSLQFPRWPLPDLPQFESNHQYPIGCSDHVTYIGPKSTAF